MSFVRLHYPAVGTGVITTYDIDTIWDVSIDAQSVGGASYWAQEGRTASFSMPYDTIWELFTKNANKPKVYRALIEIYESYTLADANGEIRPYERKVFTGYLMQGSFSATTHGEWYQSGVYRRGRTMTITAYDYISVLVKDPPFETLTLKSGTSINVEAEIRRLWELKPYSSSTSSTLALWTRPPLTYEVETTPGYGVQLTDYPLWVQSLNAAYPSDEYNCYARLYKSNDTVLIESVRLGFDPQYGPTGKYYCSHQIYRVVGSALITVLDEFLGDVNDYDTWKTQAEWEAEIGVDLAAWAAQTSVVLPLIRYKMTETVEGSNGLYCGYTVRLTGSVVIDTITTLPTEEPIEVSFLEWFQFLLNLQMAFLHEGFGDNQWAVSNKAYFSVAELYPFPESIKITSYAEAFEDAKDEFVTEFDWLLYGVEFAAAINTFMSKKNAGRYNRVCQFTANAYVPVGERIVIPRLNDNPIYITSVFYDLNQPQLYAYEGRSL
jgi:hypothetical protein